jgi:transcriptional regulator with XRE-family HTH domain
MGGRSSGGQVMMTQEEIAKYADIDRDRLEYIEHQRALFDAAKPALMAEYLDEYVAFEDGQVLDHDADRQSLAARIYAKYGYRDLLMRKVSVEERVYSIGGFRTLRSPAS